MKIPAKDNENWFDRHGVNRPVHDPHITEEELRGNFDRIRKETVHGDWRQMGNRLTCNKCVPSHTSGPIPVDYMLQGTDSNGLPILKKMDLTPKQ